MLEQIKRKFRHSYLHPRHLAQEQLWKIVAREGLNLQGRLLDVGCGQKPYASLLPRVQQHIGVDVPSSMHGLTEVNVAASNLYLPFKSACFDSILCTEVLEHVPDPLQALMEMWRVTCLGGQILLTVPFSEQLHEEPYDYFRFTRHALIFLFKKSGWDVLWINHRGGTWLELGYRLSSFVYSTLGARRTASGGFSPRPVLGPVAVILCALIQISAAGLDRIWPSELSTIGYAVFAQKQT